MNLLSKAKFSGRFRLSSLYSISSLQQSNSYATFKTPKPANPKSPASSSSFSERMKKPTGEAIVWPKPAEIPYQAKVANFVNLIGFVKAPVQFETVSNGFFAATAIAQESVGEKDPLLIPVVFEGDLAHVVATHVKENDCVLVSGQLSSEPSRFALKDGFGKYHVVCENLNFVEGFQSGVRGKKSVVGTKKPADGGIKNVVEGAMDEKFDKKWGKALEDAKLKKIAGEMNWGTSEPKIVRGGVESGESGVIVEKKDGIVRGKAESGESGFSVKKKDGDRVNDMWRDLVKNSLLWWDYRDQKAKGLVSEKYPDFKHKVNWDDVLWLDSAPMWVLPGIEKLEFDVPVVTMRANPVQRSQGSGERKSSGRDEEAWKDLVENPSKWWDNRANKKNPKGPDFKQKETGQALWLNSSPDWALSELPPLKN